MKIGFSKRNLLHESPVFYWHGSGIFSYLLYIKNIYVLDFYKNIRTLKYDLADVLADENYFVDVPPNWHVVVSDITNSTEAVATGRHGDVNLIAAGSLIAALNISKKLNTEIPYFFGGDGGTVLVPGAIVEKVIEGLKAHSLNSLKNFSLDLRIGHIPVDEIRKAGYGIRVAKVEIAKGFNKTVLIGDGLKYAEATIKKNYRSDEIKKEFKEADVELEALNMEGMECRWDKVKPPDPQLEVVCLLIEANDPKNQSAVYRDVLNKIEEIYGAVEKRHPITMNRLKLKGTIKKIYREMMARYSKLKLGYLAKTYFTVLFGKLFFRFDLKLKNIGAHNYLSELITFSEILTIDGRINTIISGTAENRILLLEYLKQEEESGQLIFGHHVSSASIMTCYIQNMNNKHIHFIDGADGGYTEAAKEFKPKARKLSRGTP